MTRPFEDLTRRGQIQRLRGLAAEALRAYDLDVARVAFTARAFNTVFRVDATDGSAYALRVSPALRVHADGCEEAEAAWVAALRRDAGFPTPAVIPTRNGEPVVRASAPGVPEPRSCVLFEWVGGTTLRRRMSVGGIRQAGALAARAHEHAVSYATEAPDGVLVADRVLYFRLPDRLEELRPAYGSAIADGLARAQLAIDGLWQSPPHAPHLLHGDLQPGNVLVARGRATLIDFQDVIWGFEIQDVVIAHHALKVQFPGRKELWDAFRSGYAEIRPWPEAEREAKAALLAARHLNVLNLGLRVRKPGLDEFVGRHAGAVLDWMRD